MIEVLAINAQAPLVIEVPAIDALPSLTSTSVDVSSQRDQNFEYDLGEFLMKPKDLSRKKCIYTIPNITSQMSAISYSKKQSTRKMETLIRLRIKENGYVMTNALGMFIAINCPEFFGRHVCSSMIRIKQNRGVFVKTAYQNISRQDKIQDHENTEYHQKSIGAAEIFIRGYENPDSNVDFEKQKAQNCDTNLHIIQRIVEAVLLCAEQGLALRGHRDHHMSESEESCCERSFGRGNFLAILDAFAKMDPILQDHLNNGKRNAKMVSWKIQNDIIASIAEFLRETNKGTDQQYEMLCSNC